MPPRRLKALSAAETAAPEAQPPPQQQFLRLPLESARKLRFYDRPDLSELVEQHARDKAQLTAANAALRQVSLTCTKRTSSEADSNIDLDKLVELDAHDNADRRQCCPAPSRC